MSIYVYIWNMGKIADTDRVNSKWLCMFTDYIEQCRRFSSLTWWSFAFDCSRHTHKEHIRGIDNDDSQKERKEIKDIAIIRSSHRWKLQLRTRESNEIHSNFWQIHTIEILEIKTAVPLYYCNFGRFVRFFSNFVILYVYWWWL